MSIEEHNLKEAESFYNQGKYSSAGIYARKVIRRAPNNAAALVILGHIAFKNRNFADAEKLYEQVLSLAHKNDEMLINLITSSEEREDFFSAYRYIVLLLTQDPNNLSMQLKLGINAMQIGKMDVAEKALMAAKLGSAQQDQASLNLGHVYKAKGETEKAASLYHEYICSNLHNQATGYWSLADLKNYKFSEIDKLAINSALNSFQLSQANQSLLYFALNRIEEQQQDYNKAFKAAKRANMLMQPIRPFKEQLFVDIVKRLTTSQPYLSVITIPQNNWIPIFIVGMPRSGSTLTEQILASHSKVNSTDELPYMERLALKLEQNGGYEYTLSKLTPEQIVSMRTEYITQTSQYLLANTSCKESFIIDKNPNNFMHIGLIKVLFPESKVINVVRDATDNGLGVFKQHFSRGHNYSYSFEGICLYWQQYLNLMRHWDECFPGQVYHLSFEELVLNPTKVIPDILKFCGLAFEPECLRFYESKRVVLTPSASQVRRPMNKKAIGQSKSYQKFMPNEYQVLSDITSRAQQLFKLPK
ncbi:tetratricopeptide repeat-containing sulfotransferase family protein [Shewanella woodyi]|uniref:tetratricopeptide repeat-containing sulfotransferase family protein n=1 Tax=Shewanella woodyi TaxID=60961 RepID=UPI003749440F